MSNYDTNDLRAQIDAAKAKLPLPTLLAELGLAEHSRTSARCPIHEDRSPSFSVWQGDKGWRWKCHAGCGEGDEIDFLETYRRSTKTAAVRLFLEMAGDSGSFTPSPRPPSASKAAPAIYAMTDAELKRAAKAAEKLGTSPSLCAGIATKRGWKWQTIQQLASECSLGVDGGKLAFIYPTGIKLRWQVNGERRFAFACGKPHALWRGHLRECRTTRAIITEGETDAIRLIDLGYDDATTRVFSVPSASTWPLGWKTTLAGLDEVVFALDADEAGQRHVAEWAALIRPHVSKVRAINWQEATK